ncbi:T9SS type A sorting domain-containing protein, partial [candidate division WOR-3 bacterium]|nr:T9SS type A sorting domain-containing protein [candidate division WOR-3 bacterium]
NSWMDHISPTGTGFLVFVDGNNAYDCGVANDAGTYRTVGTSFELGLLTDGSGVSTRAALLDSIMKFFGCQVNPGVRETDADRTKQPYDRLFAVYPNPSFQKAAITYSIASTTEVRLSIVDVCGRSVCSLFSGKRDPGQYSLIWDGCDNQGKRVSAGVYFIAFSTADHATVQKIIKVR